jgi:hypothetical protein
MYLAIMECKSWGVCSKESRCLLCFLQTYKWTIFILILNIVVIWFFFFFLFWNYLLNNNSNYNMENNNNGGHKFKMMKAVCPY